MVPGFIETDFFVAAIIILPTIGSFLSTLCLFYKAISILCSYQKLISLVTIRNVWSYKYEMYQWVCAPITLVLVVEGRRRVDSLSFYPVIWWALVSARDSKMIRWRSRKTCITNLWPLCIYIYLHIWTQVHTITHKYWMKYFCQTTKMYNLPLKNLLQTHRTST